MSALLNINLVGTLSEQLNKQLKDFGVCQIWVECGELNVRSNFDLPISYAAAIENELIEKGFDVEPHFSLINA